MSQIILNRNDQDLIEVDFFQHGASHTETTLRDELLDGEKSYHFCISNLSVPMRHCPIHPVSSNVELFRIQPRAARYTQVDQLPVSAASLATFREIYDYELTFGALQEKTLELLGEGLITYAQLAVHAEVDEEDFEFENFQNNVEALQSHVVNSYITSNQTFLTEDTMFATPARPHYSVTSFCNTLSERCELFNREMTETGINPSWFDFAGQDDRLVPDANINNQEDVRKYIEIKLSCDGSLLFVPSNNFWDFFVISFTGYGAALLGIDTSALHRTPEGRFMLGLTNNSFSGELLQRTEVGTRFHPANNTNADVVFIAHHPVFSTCDQRVKVSVGSHLPILSNVLINNEKQSSERDIAEAFFETKIKAEVLMTDQQHSVQISSNVYAGQVNLIKKHDPQHTWNKLISSYRLRYMRFFLYITYRDYQISTNTFKLRKMPVTVDPEDYWAFSVRFVSDS